MLVQTGGKRTKPSQIGLLSPASADMCYFCFLAMLTLRRLISLHQYSKYSILMHGLP